MLRQFVLLDVDNTLYPRACGVVDRVELLINRYLVDRLGIPEAEVDGVRHELWRDFGTTLHGLMWRGPVDRDDYLAYVHAIELDRFIAPDPALGAMLAGLPLMKVAVTNGSRAHGRAVLAHLGITDLFFDVYGLEQLAYVPKPYVQAYQTVLRSLHARGDECVLVEDSSANLRAARTLGMATVHVADGHPPDPSADAVIASIHALPAALARLDAPPARVDGR
jgi:putative hydrolase of the HAD superfamily